MSNNDLVMFLRGATAMGCLALAVCFLRFWTHARDRLFALFSVAFVLLAAHYIATLVVAGDETEAFLYAIRALAFALIILAILDKNRRPG